MEDKNKKKKAVVNSPSSPSSSSSDDESSSDPPSEAPPQKGMISLKSKAIKKDKKREGVVTFDSSSDEEEAAVDDDDDVSDTSSDHSSDEEEKGGPPLVNFYKDKKRAFTISIVVPSSIIDNAQSFELKTYLVGQIAKSCGLFKVNEIIVYSNDRTHRMKNMSSEITTTEFFVRNLEYIETPQYLRKALFPRSDALKYSGLVNPLEGDHHLKITEWCRYREGVIVRRPVRENKGSWANIGLYKDCQVNMMLEENTRVTVRLNEGGFS